MGRYRRHIRNDSSAISEVVSSLLSITIVMSVIAMALFWGRPYVDQIQTESSLQTTFQQLSVIVDSTQEVITKDTVSARQNELTLKGASLSLDSQGTRMVFAYCFDPLASFTALDFADGKASFEFFYQALGNSRVQVFWFHESSTPAMGDQPLPNELIDYSSMTFHWVPSFPAQNFSFLLENYTSLWSSYSPITSTSYRNLPDGNYTFRVEDDQSTFDEKIPFEIVEGYEKVDTEIYMTPSKITSDLNDIFPSDSLSGTMRVDIYQMGPNRLLGRLYIFDLGRVECTYRTSAGVFKQILENNALLELRHGSGRVRLEPAFSVQNNLLSCRIVQLRASGAIGSSGFGVQKLGFVLVENYVREILTPVHNLKIQVTGPHAQTWLNYLHYTHGFEFDTIYNTVRFPDPIMLTLTQSLCTVDLQ